jgi:hypothetical protein
VGRKLLDSIERDLMRICLRSLLKKGTDNSVHKRIRLMARIGSVGDRAVCPLFQQALRYRSSIGTTKKDIAIGEASDADA